MLLKKSKALITRKFNDRVIVFTRTKIDCHRLCLFLKCLKLKVDELHGGLTQVQVINIQKQDSIYEIR
jgi:superfamily II DNA/RNA helicase